MKRSLLSAIALVLAPAAGAVAQTLPVRGPVASPTPVAASALPGGLTYQAAINRYVALFTVPASPTNGDVYLVLVDPNSGAATAPVALLVSPANVSHPSLTWNAGSQHFLFTFQVTIGLNDQLQGLILDAVGVPVGQAATPFVIASIYKPIALTDLPSYSVASDGHDWIAVWGGAGNNYYPTGIAGMRIGGSATCTSPQLGTVFQVETTICSHPTVTWAGDRNFITAWTVNNAMRRRVISGIDGTAGGMVPTSTGKTIPYGNRPALAADPGSGEALVCWNEDISVGSIRELIAQKLNADGTAAAAPSAITTGTSTLSRSEVTWCDEADQYVVAWSVAGQNSTYELWTAGVDLAGRPLTSGFPAKAAGPFTWPTGSGFPLRAALRPGQNEIAYVFTTLAAGASSTQMLRFCPGPSPERPVISDMTQRPPGGGEAIPAGGLTKRAGVQLQAAVTDPRGLLARLQVELREDGQPFDGTPTQVSDWAPGGPAVTITIPLPRQTSWNWRARVQNINQQASPWVDFGPVPPTSPDLTIRSNAMPAGSGTALRDTATGSALPAGARLQEARIGLVTTPSDADPTDVVRLEIELRGEGEGFSGVPTDVGAFVGAGQETLVALQAAEGANYLRWRVADDAGDFTTWTALPADGSPAFTRLPFGSTMTSAGCLASAPGGAALLPLLAACLSGSYFRWTRLSARSDRERWSSSRAAMTARP